MSVVVLSKNVCGQCDLSKMLLTREGVPFVERNMEEDPEAMALAKELGYLQAPVIIAGDKNWSGFQPDLIKALAA